MDSRAGTRRYPIASPPTWAVAAGLLLVWLWVRRRPRDKSKDSEPGPEPDPPGDAQAELVGADA